MSSEMQRDPRSVLAREKYFSIRPKPLERWLWAQGVPAAAERVFWVHWQEGQQRGDWCSQIPLRRVARDCCLDPSTVTRSYQLLARLGCLRRTDPGRDPANPFCQATAITEVRVPRELLVELERHPNRRVAAVGAGQAAGVGAHRPMSPEPAMVVATDAEPARPADPFAGMRARERLQALGRLTAAMSAAEESRFREALRLHRTHFEFDADSRLAAQERGRVLQFLACVAAAPARSHAPVAPQADVPTMRRTLTVFELARLRREILAVRGGPEAPELLRQVVWSVEQGSLKRFAPLHALHIALKKIREGAWTRPHRMPPNWMRGLGAAPETCAHA